MPIAISHERGDPLWMLVLFHYALCLSAMVDYDNLDTMIISIIIIKLKILNQVQNIEWVRIRS